MRTFWFCIAVLVLVGITARGLYLRRRQIRRLRDLAARRHFNFASEDLIDVCQRYQRLQLIDRGYSRHACNLLYGSADVGLITLFCYSYDLGFGVHRATEQWWIGVLETSNLHAPWRCGPSERIAEIAPEAPGRILHADHTDTRRRLETAGVVELLGQAPPECQFEAAGPFLAAAAPFDTTSETPDRLLSTLLDLALALKTPDLDHAVPEHEHTPEIARENERSA